MSEYSLPKEQLISESDVEQKVIYPLLTNPEPMGLGYNSALIQTKHNLKKFTIGKGPKSSSYFPDYIITIDGVPVIIIEVKKPHEDLIEAYREASLYAGEINRMFPKGLNPCQLVVASDGLKLLAGEWDSATAEFEIETNNWVFTEINFSKFLNKFSLNSTNNFALEFKKQLRKNVAYKRPVNLLGGKYIQNQTTKNTFGETISINYRHLFNPNVIEEREDIVRNAYVKVNKHESHVAPIDKLIRKKVAGSLHGVVDVKDTEAPTEITDKLSNSHLYNNQVLLIVGSVGAGKLTFATYLKEVALAPNLVEKLAWITLDLNNIPVARNEIYPWIKKNIIAQIKDSYKEVDFDAISTIEHLYNGRIAALKKGPLSLLNPESDKYKELLVGKILEYQSDLDISLESYITQYVHNKGRDLVIVLDNCDKRNLEEQLLMFEIANWIKDSIKAIVFLPLRDTTYDLHRKEKPLDTVIKDLIFRISPPSLEKVIYSRIKYALRLSEKRTDKFYILPNGIKVQYPSNEELYYLKSILKSLFQNGFFKRLISGLAGGDIRAGLEIFLDFCKSGHITEIEILKIKQSKGDFELPNHIISKVFLRGNRLYYSDAETRIKNLFHSSPLDELPDPFVRVAILRWLDDRLKTKGPSGIVGFHPVNDLTNNLVAIGHSKLRIEEELKILLLNALIVSESQRVNEFDPNELVSINVPGIVHLELLKNIDYLSACAEDVWYNVVAVAEEIHKNISGAGEFSHLSLQNNVTHSKLLIDYLQSYYQAYFTVYSQYLDEKTFSSPVEFARILEIIDSKRSSIKHNPSRELKKDVVYDGVINNINDLGIFVKIEDTKRIGLIHPEDIPEADYKAAYTQGQPLKIKIKYYKSNVDKYGLLFA